MKKALLLFMLACSMFAHTQVNISDFKHGNSKSEVQNYYYSNEDYEYEEDLDLQGFEPQLRISFDEGIDSYKNFSFGFDFLATYRANEHFRIGAGIGINYVNLFYEDAEIINHKYFDAYFESAMTIPIFANIKVNFTKTKISPYLGIDAGYNVFIPFSKYAEQNKLGAFFKPTFGFDFHFESCTLFLEVAYRYQMRKFTYWTDPKGNYSQITQCIGIQF